MLYRKVMTKRSSSTINKAEKLNILSSHGICPLCGKRLVDDNGYIGSNLFLNNLDRSFTIVTCCRECYRSLNKKVSFNDLKDYLDNIEVKINNLWNEED